MRRKHVCNETWAGPVDVRSLATAVISPRHTRVSLSVDVCGLCVCVCVCVCGRSFVLAE